MRVDKIIDLVIISHRDTCPFLSRDGDKMCKHLKDCDMDCDYMSSFAVQGHGAVQRMREAGYQPRRP